MMGGGYNTGVCNNGGGVITQGIVMMGGGL